MFVVTVTFQINAEYAALFTDAVMQQAKNSLTLESDCHIFDVCVADSDPTTIFLYEKYSDARAFDQHLDSEHFKAFDALVLPWVTSKEVGKWNQTGSSA
jgi:quinol monooxygenase YgiN